MAQEELKKNVTFKKYIENSDLLQLDGRWAPLLEWPF
jgi:hypothetical protein